MTRLERISQKMTDRLVQICDDIMPKQAGLDVMNVEFSPLLENEETVDSSSAQIEEIAGSLSQDVMTQILPVDIREKGRKMTSVYLYLYNLENMLRLFIQKVAKETGKPPSMNTDSRNKIRDRREDAAKKKWLPMRGDSDLFYLDFEDLGSIIRNNWKTFSSFFPNLNWIDTKISELADCRNLIAHNSYLEDQQSELVKVYYKSILSQLNEAMKAG